MNEKKKFSIDILNDFVNILITDVANKYLKKLKKDKKNPHKLIEDYLDQAVFLSEEDIKIWTISNHIDSISEETKEEFNYLVEQDKEYKNLVKKLNFVFNVIKYEELQFKVLTSLYENFNKFSSNDKVHDDVKNNLNYNSVFKEVNKNKKMINELNYFL